MLCLIHTGTNKYYVEEIASFFFRFDIIQIPFFIYGFYSLSKCGTACNASHSMCLYSFFHVLRCANSSQNVQKTTSYSTHPTYLSNLIPIPSHFPSTPL